MVFSNVMLCDLVDGYQCIRKSSAFIFSV